VFAAGLATPSRSRRRTQAAPATWAVYLQGRTACTRVPTHVAWYIDGVKCGQFNGNASSIESGPMQLILHMMIDNQ
jgi:hypothetical protein